MLTVELNIKWVVDVAARANGNADAVFEVGIVVAVGRLWRVCLRFVQLETDLTQIIKLWYGGALDLGINATLKYAVEECVDMGLLGKVEEAFRVVGRLHILEIRHDLSEERK